MIFRKLLRNRGLGLNLIAGACFILLLVNGWGLSWRELGGYLLALLILLAGLIGLAALCGWLLHKLLKRNDTSVGQSEDNLGSQAHKASDSEAKK